MPRLQLDAAAVSRLLDRLCSEAEGQWLLVGGAAASLWFLPDRVTEDVDLVGLQGEARERLQLMELAAKEGLPVEAVNSAADFFVTRIADWRAHIEVLRRGPRATMRSPAGASSYARRCRASGRDAPLAPPARAGVSLPGRIRCYLSSPPCPSATSSTPSAAR